MALGFYHSLRCVSSQPLHVWDVMPGDLVVNCILAAAAAVAAGESGGTGAHSVRRDGQLAVSTDSRSSVGPMLIVQSSSSSTYPMTLMEGWNAGLEFIAAHPPKMRLSTALPGMMTPAFRPDPAAVQRERRWTALKVWLACCLLR